MLPIVGADDLDVHESHVGVQGHLFPLAPGQLDRVAGIGGDADARAQNVGRNPVGQPIALPLHVERAKIPERLLDGIDSQVSGTDALDKQLG